MVVVGEGGRRAYLLGKLFGTPMARVHTRGLFISWRFTGTFTGGPEYVKDSVSLDLFTGRFTGEKGYAFGGEFENAKEVGLRWRCPRASVFS